MSRYSFTVTIAPKDNLSKVEKDFLNSIKENHYNSNTGLYHFNNYFGFCSEDAIGSFRLEHTFLTNFKFDVG